MASDINAVFMIGRLTKDPELKYTRGGTAVCSFSIANNRSYLSGGEKKELVSYFNCIAWTKRGEVINEYCKKGHRIGIEGRLQQRSYEDSDGKKRRVVEIVIESIQFLQTQGIDQRNSAINTGTVVDASTVPDQTDENPFSDMGVPL